MAESKEVALLTRDLQTEKNMLRRQQLLKKLWKLRQATEQEIAPIQPSHPEHGKGVGVKAD